MLSCYKKNQKKIPIEYQNMFLKMVQFSMNRRSILIKTFSKNWDYNVIETTIFILPNTKMKKNIRSWK